MKLISKTLLSLILIASSATVFGQGITTASFSGTVSDKNGDPLPGAVINAVHEPTGTRYSTVSRANGTFKIFNVRVGGPYELTATMTGFKTQKDSNIFLKIGEDYHVDFAMALDTVEETLVVVAESNPIINPSRTGAVSNVSEEALEKLPSISRSFEDYARTNPYFSSTAFNSGDNSITVAGRSNRYNTILIDGAVNNDLFGLSATGAPGGQAESPFISLDALQEVQLLVAPYDIRQSGFSGGGVNAVTRSGSNNLEGSIFHYFRSDDYIGDGPNDQPFGELDDKQTGFRVGGPIIKDKVFFFANYERRRKGQPNGWAVRDGVWDNGTLVSDTTGVGQNFGHLEEITEIVDILRDRYGYDPGGLDDLTRDTDSDSMFIRFDFNIGDNHQLTIRHNLVDAENLRTGNDNNTWQFAGNHQFFPSKTNSTVLQINSTFGDLYNEGRISYTTVKDRRRGVGDPFPWIEIESLSSPDGRPNAEVEIGTERFSTANSLDQDILEITDDLTFFKGDHTITVGTHNEIFSFDNLFIREAYGAYEFATLEHFRNGWARTYNHSFSSQDLNLDGVVDSADDKNGDGVIDEADGWDPNKSAAFDVTQLGLYAGDQWAITPDFNLTLGLRVDVPFFPDTPTRNPLAEEFGYRTDVTADGNALWSPRVGFNWDITGDSKNQLRGGAGYFTGRSPYVWVSNQYSNTGIEFTRISVFNRSNAIDENNFVPFEADPFNQPKNIPGAGGNEINVIDEGFEFPQVRRWNVAYDRDLGIWGMVATAEYIYTENINDIVYRNLNWAPNGDTFFDGRPMFSRVNTTLRDVILLDNSDEGDQTNWSLKLERPFKDGLWWNVSYVNGESNSVNDGTSSQARSNWRFNPVGTDPNNPEVGTSVYEVKHRINMAVSYKFGFERAPTTVSLFYNAQSGRPYSNSYRFDVNGDGESNDLMYVPASADEVIITNGTWEDFNAYVEADEGLRNARGTTIKRNASYAPWQRTLDFRLAQDVRVSRYSFQFTWDIINLLNLLDSDDGELLYVSNNNISPVRYDGLDEETGKPIYNLQLTDPDQRWTQDNTRSRWAMQFGLRFSF